MALHGLLKQEGLFAWIAAPFLLCVIFEGGTKSDVSLCEMFSFKAKDEFSSTAEIVQTIQTMTANLAKVNILYSDM